MDIFGGAIYQLPTEAAADPELLQGALVSLSEKWPFKPTFGAEDAITS